MAFFSILLFSACERADNRGYEGPNFVEQAIITKKKLELFRLQMESMQPAQKQALAHKQINSKIDLATLTQDETTLPVFLLGTRNESHDYSMIEYNKVEGARRRLFIFSKPKEGRDYTITNSSPNFAEHKQADGVIAACMIEQRLELKRITDRFPKLLVLLEHKEILITNFPTDKVGDWETPNTVMESSIVEPSVRESDVVFSNVLYVTVPNLWIDGFGASQGQVAKQYCHGIVSAEDATRGLIKQVREANSDITLDLSLERLMELKK